MTNTITVPFYDHELYVVEHNNEPYAPMKPIVEGMGLDWKSQLNKIKSRFRKGMVEITIPSKGGEQSMVCLQLRKLSAWMLTIYPNKVKSEIRGKVIQYKEECDDVLYQYWTTGRAINPRKLSVMEQLNEACADYKWDEAIASKFGNAINDDCYLVVAAKLDLKSGMTCVHTGTGNLIIAGEVYQGVGQFGSIESVKEGLSTSPTQLLLSLSGFDSKLIGEVLNERSRGRDVRLMLVAIDEDNGQPILADVIFAGQIANLNVTTGDENGIGPRLLKYLLTVSKQTTNPKVLKWSI